MIKQTIITIATLGLLSLTASAEFDTIGCVGCHGEKFEKAAMSKSKIVKDMTKDEIITALKGYKDGSYGGQMKGIMKGQALKMSEEDIATFAENFAEESNSTDKNVTEAPAKEVNVTGCIGCHGKNFEKSAMSTSKKVNEMNKADIVTALTGYKDGSYGGKMKGMMKAQATPLSENDIKAIAEKFGK